MIGLVLVVVGILAVLVGRGMDNPLAAVKEGEPAGHGGTVPVTAVIGSEKRPFFEDQRVVDIFADHGWDVEVDVAGSRQIATSVNLSNYDLAFPSSAPAADKIAGETDNLGTGTPFYSPMAIATFEDILAILEQEEVARQVDGHWFIDMAAYVELAASPTRWRDLSESYPSPRTVQISSTDIKTSNSAAMYLSILAWVLNDGRVATAGDVEAIVTKARLPFTGQGYTEHSSAGPFEDYLSQGIGAKPMVMVYEAQFLGEEMREDSRIAESMVLAYPDPTVLSSHTTVALSENGAEIARLLAEDPQLQGLAAEHGFRPSDPGTFTDVLSRHGAASPPAFLPTVDTPAYEQLEALIDGVGAQGPTPPVPTESEESQ